MEREPTASFDASSEVLERLNTRGESQSRYIEKDLIGKGGMGAILRVWDEDLRRNLAMKVVLDDQGRRSGDSTQVDQKRLGRFLEEAQVTAQLEHPGIVPVHELGIDENGAVYFTMQLVKGRDLGQIYSLLHKGLDKEWTETRALMVLLKVCDAMAYAHEKGVVHRDLKPENIMVGRFGEVYVMDWGLAHVEGQTDSHDLRLDSQEITKSIIESDRSGRKIGAQDSESMLYTMDGDVLGTPAFMSPEQARGDVEALGPHSDVYSMGAMLYHLLAGHMPFCPEGADVSPLLVLRWLLEGGPQPIAEIVPEIAPELTAICDKAMAREPADRYADMSLLAHDLRAYLEDRIVSAYGGGAMLQFKKWVTRNRALAAAWGVVLAVALGGLTAVSVIQSSGKKAEHEQRTIAETNEAMAKLEHAKVMRLSAFQFLRDLETRADTMWPVTPGLAGDYQNWLQEADELIAGLATGPAPEVPGHHAMLEELRTRSSQAPGSSADPAQPEEAQTTNTTYLFQDADDSWWHGQLEKLVSEIEAFANEDTGLVRGVSPERSWGIARRLEHAQLLERSLATAVWNDAIDQIAKAPAYGGLSLDPQLGLVPLGTDPDSGLWEFGHLASGRIPARSKTGYLELAEDTSLILVLMPGGSFHMGAQGLDAAGFNYDTLARPDESPVREVVLAPYFLSKYEMTQGQWLRLTGSNPSNTQRDAPDVRFAAFAADLNLMHPVEQVTWEQAARVLRRFGLTLPTEAQWEFGARAGAESPWWIGAEREFLEGVGNFADQFAASSGASWGQHDVFSDGYFFHAPVGTMEANPFGLLDVHGNVWEWCADQRLNYGTEPSPGSGLREGAVSEARMLRGGAYNKSSLSARCAHRESADPTLQSPDIGLRPARSIQR